MYAGQSERTCPCGSGEPSRWVNDARGIPLGRVCRKCSSQKLSRFRREVLTDANYECDEPVEDDE